MTHESVIQITTHLQNKRTFCVSCIWEFSNNHKSVLKYWNPFSNTTMTSSKIQYLNY